MVNEKPTPRFLDGVLALAPLRLAIWVATIGALFPAFFTNPHKLHHFMDDHQFYNWEQADRISILEFGQLPLWNPYYCGGIVSAAAPESGVFAPDYLLRLVYGVADGRRLALVLFLILGMEGTYRLARHCNASALASLFAALVFSTYNKLVQVWLGMGWVHFFGFELLPWVILGLVKGEKSVSWRIVGALALGWIALAAGTYTAPYTGIAVTFVTISMCTRHLSPWKPKELRATLAAAGTVIGGGALLAVAKLGPMMLVMRQYPRVFTPVEVNDKFTLLGQYWAAYGLVVLLAFVALLFRDFWARVFFLAACLFFVLAMGQFDDLAPATLMKKLPLVSGLRFPDRFTLMFHFFAVLAAALGVTHLEDLATRTVTRLWAWRRPPEKRLPAEAVLVPVVISAAVAFLVYRVGRGPTEAMLQTAKIPPYTMYTVDAPRPVDQPFKQHRGNRRDAHVFPEMARGSMYCFVGIPLPQSAKLRADLEEEEYAEDPSSATVKRQFWSPHEIRLEVDAKKPARILVNQNYNPHWRSDVGTVVDSDRLLAVDVPAGKHLVTLRYRDYTSYLFFAISLATFGFFAAHLGKRGRHHAKAALERWKAVGLFTLEQDREKKDEKGSPS